MFEFAGTGQQLKGLIIGIRMRDSTLGLFTVQLAQE